MLPPLLTASEGDAPAIGAVGAAAAEAAVEESDESNCGSFSGGVFTFALLFPCTMKSTSAAFFSAAIISFDDFDLNSRLGLAVRLFPIEKDEAFVRGDRCGCSKSASVSGRTTSLPSLVVDLNEEAREGVLLPFDSALRLWLLPARDGAFDVSPLPPLAFAASLPTAAAADAAAAVAVPIDVPCKLRDDEDLDELSDAAGGKDTSTAAAVAVCSSVTADGIDVHLAAMPFSRRSERNDDARGGGVLRGIALALLVRFSGLVGADAAAAASSAAAASLGADMPIAAGLEVGAGAAPDAAAAQSALDASFLSSLPLRTRENEGICDGLCDSPPAAPAPAASSALSSRITAAASNTSADAD